MFEILHNPERGRWELYTAGDIFLCETKSREMAEILAEQLAQSVSAPRESLVGLKTLAGAVSDLTRDMIVEARARSGTNMGAAKLLGIKRTTLLEKMRVLGLLAGRGNVRGEN